MMSSDNRLGASFRDPNGFLFWHNGLVYRQVNQSYKQHFDLLIESGLYTALVKDKLLLPHDEVDLVPTEPGDLYKILRPRQLGFISYPYEWSFSQLKDAALVTLTIQKRAIEYGILLKDASAYNIQFVECQPMLIDTLSFEIYHEGTPWVAYKQFCQHFLAPLALMSYRDVRLSQLMRVHIDGIPIDLASKLLPKLTRLTPAIALHIHMHASAQQRFASKPVDDAALKRKMSKNQMLGLIDSLEGGIRKLKWLPTGTEWNDYYEKIEHYSDKSLAKKVEVVNMFIDRILPESVWDLGANVGVFSRLANSKGIPTVAFDIDPGAVERNYLDCKQAKEKRLLPLLLDLTNPSPALGWHSRERMSLMERSPTDMVLALALIHHLAISNNVPLPLLASFFAAVGEYLTIEFVPKSDPQVELLLATRLDIFPNYTKSTFEAVFREKFEILETVDLQNTHRTLYLMKKLSDE